MATDALTSQDREGISIEVLSRKVADLMVENEQLKKAVVAYREASNEASRALGRGNDAAERAAYYRQ